MVLRHKNNDDKYKNKLSWPKKLDFDILFLIK